jgi:hypothetical protein
LDHGPVSNLEALIVRSFAGGELAPSLAARADLAKYTIGLRRCRNFVVQRHGGVANRAGTRFVNNCRDNSGNVQLLRYVSETDGQSVLIEAGVGYLRFYLNGGLVTVDQGGLDAWSGAVEYAPGDLVTSGGVAYYCKLAHDNEVPPNATYWHPLTDDIYEVPTPFTGSAYRFKWTQSGRVITLTHRSVPTHDLVFQSIIRWVLVPLTTAPKVAPPENLVVDFGAGARTFAYRVTAAAPDSYEESESGVVTGSAAAAEPTEADPHVLTWDVVLTPPVTGTGSPEYYIYCDPYGNGTFGFVGTATGTNTFNNPGITPDFSITPPLARELFTDADERPEACAYHQQRRFLANTNNTPDAVYGSRVGFPDNFGIASPLQEDDAITFRVAGNSNHAVHWIIGLRQLILLTGGGEWAVGRPLEPLTPNDIPADQETYVGISSTVRPVVVGNSILYLQARGAIVRDLQFDQEVEGLAGRDLTIFASHLFDGRAIVDMDYAQTPHSIVWCVRNDGTLLGLTYNREQDVWGWHRHDTQLGGWERICVVPEAGEDVVYLVAGRTVNGQAVRFIEKIETRTILNFAADAFFVDAGLSYAGSPVSSVAGLDHLEGEVVAVLADGEVLYNGDPEGDDAADWTVTGGAISLGAAYSNIHIGLAITAELQTLDLDVGGTDLRTKKKRVQAVSVILDESGRTFEAGTNEDTLTRYRQDATDPTGFAFTGTVDVTNKGKWEAEGRVFLRHSDPTPITVLGVVPHIEVGG